jgi:hypothetical protein
MHGKRPLLQRKHNPLFKNLIRCEGCGGMVTWQLQKGRYYGTCQRLKPGCKGVKALREDRIEDYIVKMLDALVCPSQEIIEWVTNELRKRRSDQSDTREQALQSLRAQIIRLERMDNELYDDKLAGDISRETYSAKHASLQSQKVELETKREKLAEGTQCGLEQRLALLRLSQKAAEIYQTRTIEQKRLIITKLFKSITSFNGSVSVTYTKLTQAIARNSGLSKEILGYAK